MIKKIYTVCTTGLGSSFYVELNIKKVLQKHGLEADYLLSHSALFDMDWYEADYVVVAKDMEAVIPDMVTKIVLGSIIDIKELEEKLLRALGDD